jgi:cytidine deaminase
MAEAGHFLQRDAHLDPGHEFIRAMPSMVEKARTAALEEAVSYRELDVGAAGLALRPPAIDTGIYTGGNIKPSKHPTTICAEKVMIEKAKKAGFTVIAGIVVASSATVEEIKSVVHVPAPTLPPCPPCSNYFVESPLMRQDTVIVSVPLDSDKRQIRLHAELRASYLNGYLHELEEAPVRYGFEDWDKRVQLYEDLARAERELPPEEQRTIGKLVQMALLAS